jgi:hypothetical protein
MFQNLSNVRHIPRKKAENEMNRKSNALLMNMELISLMKEGLLHS